MKFQITFKTPDVLDQLTDDEKERYYDVIKRFIKWGEYITIEFDSETMTAKVLEV